jgi:glutamate racemase
MPPLDPMEAPAFKTFDPALTALDLPWAAAKPVHLMVMDSGVGGLNVLKTLWHAHLGCNISFIADSAWMPYGDKDPQVLEARLLRLVGQLLTQYKDNAYILFACNTASAVWEGIAPEVLARHGIRPDRVIDILRPTLSLLMREIVALPSTTSASSKREVHVGLMATPLTVASGAYPRLAEALYAQTGCPRLHWQNVACLHLAQAVEGNPDVEAVEVLLDRYARLFQTHPPDALLIGCTHYLNLKALLRQYMPNTVFIDPSEALVYVICERLGIERPHTPETPQLPPLEGVRLLATGQRSGLSAYLTQHLPELQTLAFEALTLS